MEINRTYPCNLANYQEGRKQGVTYLVIHYVGALGNAGANAKYYGSAPGIGASAHYFVGHADEGSPIYASVPEGDTAWHCGASRYKHLDCRNANSIGIELCCHQSPGGAWYFDPETVAAAVALGRDIMARYRIPATHVLRHYDVTGKLCPAPFVNDPDAWGKFKERLEASDVTREEVQALLEASKPKVYTDITQAPKWAQGLVQRAVEAGILKGDQTGGLSLTDQDLKTLSMLSGAGLF